MDTIIEQSRLLQISGLKNRSALRKHLRRAGIPFKEIAGNIITTQGALDAAMVGHARKTKGPDLDAITSERKG